MSWYLDVLKKYAQFSGRARRKEYWMFVLFNSIVMVCISVAGSVIGSVLKMPVVLFALMVVYALFVFIPSIALVIRRLHDINKSGWAIFYNFIPAVGPFIFLYFMVKDSQSGDNQYGPNPKETSNVTVAVTA